MKNSNVAFGLSFVLPGAGFVYLKRYKLAALNLCIVLAIGAVLAFGMPEAFWGGATARALPYAVGGGSGGWAMSVAEKMNAEAEKDARRVSSLDDISEEARL